MSNPKTPQDETTWPQTRGEMTCPECGSQLSPDAPEGLCPECLLRQALRESAAAPSVDPEVGAGVRIGYLGDYELIREIGRGGMGVVYEARQLSLERTVAVKLLLGGAWSAPPMLERFRREARAAARLKHPSIVAVHEIGEQGEQPFFSMDYIVGRSLEDLVRRGPIAPKRAARLVCRVAEAVQFAHRHGVLHRDLKPSNVLLDAEDEPHITDFGLAKYLSAEPGLTATGDLLGTPGYMPPEQVRAVGSADGPGGPASDVYSIGAILYSLLTGRPPIQAESRLETALAVLSVEPNPPRQINSAVARDLDTICLKCLARDPGRRYLSAADLAEDLDRFLDGRPIMARRAGIGERAWRVLRRRPVHVLVAMILLILTALGIYQKIRVQQARSAAFIAQARVANQSGDLETAFEAIAETAEIRATATLRAAAIEVLTTPGARRIYHFPLGQVMTIELSTDHRYLAASGTKSWVEEWRNWNGAGSIGRSESGIHVWDLSSGKTLGSLPTADSFRANFGFASEDPLLASYEVEHIWGDRSHKDGGTVQTVIGAAAERVVVWNLDDIEAPRTVERPEPSERGLGGEHPFVLSPNGHRLARPHELGYGDSHVEVWHLDSGTIEPLPIRGQPLAFTAQGELLIRAVDRLVTWDLDRGEITGTEEGVFVASSADASVVVFTTRGEAPELVFQELASRRPLGRLPAPIDVGKGFLLSPNGALAAMATENPAAIHLWNLSALDQGPQIVQLGLGGLVVLEQATFSPDGSMLAAFAGEAGQGEVRVWDTDSGDEIARLRDQHLPEWAGRQLVTVGDRQMNRGGSHTVGSHFDFNYRRGELRVGNTSANVWEIRTGIPTYPLPKAVNSLTVHPGNRQLAANEVVWSLIEQDGRYLLRVDETVLPGEVARFDALGRLWAIEHLERDVVPFKIRRLRPDPAAVSLQAPDYPEYLLRDLQAQTMVPQGRDLAFAPDGKTAVIVADLMNVRAGGGGFGSREAALEHWDLETGRRLALWDYDDAHNVASYSPDGRWIAAGEQMWEVATGRSVHILEQNLSQVRYLFSPDGKQLFADTHGAAIAVFDVETGDRILAWESGNRFIRDFALSSDGRLLATGGDSPEVALWDPETGEELVRWTAHETSVSAVAFLSGGQILATGGADGRLKLWDLDQLRDGLVRLDLAW